MERIISIVVDHLEIVVAITGGVAVVFYMLVRQSGSSENDLTPLYIKHKRYTDNIAKSTKSLF